MGFWPPISRHQRLLGWELAQCSSASGNTRCVSRDPRGDLCLSHVPQIIPPGPSCEGGYQEQQQQEEKHASYIACSSAHLTLAKCCSCFFWHRCNAYQFQSSDIATSLRYFGLGSLATVRYVASEALWTRREANTNLTLDQLVAGCGSRAGALLPGSLATRGGTNTVPCRVNRRRVF